MNITDEILKVGRHVKTQKFFMYAGIFFCGCSVSNIIYGADIFIQIAAIIFNLLMISGARQEIKKHTVMMFKIGGNESDKI